MGTVDLPADPHGHRPVLDEPVVELLAPRPGDVAVDLTVGRGGHSARFAEHVAGAPGGRVIGFDLDPANLAYGQARVEAAGVPFTGHGVNFALAERILSEDGSAADVVLADLGFASTQIDDPERGFSFRHDAPLDMRYARTGPSASDLLATWSERELTELLFRVGEEPLARRIARKLVQSRGQKPIDTTSELAALVREAYGARARTARRDPATRTFMALRIAVNEELESLGMLLESIQRGAEQAASGGWLRPGARVGIISFHSLEDRLVKRAFRDLGQRDVVDIITRRPVTADAQEVRDNPRARSAKLRVVRIAEGSLGEAIR